MCQRLKPYSDKPKMAKLTVVRTGFTNNLAQRITHCCIRSAVTLQSHLNHSLLVPRLIEIFRLYYPYTGDTTQARVFRQCIFNKSLRFFIRHLIHLQLCEQAVLWEICLLNASVKWLNAEIREKLLSFASFAQHYKNWWRDLLIFLFCLKHWHSNCCCGTPGISQT